MTKQRSVFSAEFKREAADLVLKQNYSFIEASRSLGVGESALLRWRRPGSARAPRRYSAEQSADPGTTENPGAGSSYRST